jgi:transport family protein 27
MNEKISLLSRIKEYNHKSIVILRCKVVIVGDACIGKTAMTQVFVKGGSNYPKNYLMVICFIQNVLVKYVN